MFWREKKKSREDLNFSPSDTPEQQQNIKHLRSVCPATDLNIQEKKFFFQSYAYEKRR